MHMLLRGLFFVLLLSCQACTGPGPACAEENLANHIREALQQQPDLVLDVLREHPLAVIEILEQAVTARRVQEQRRQQETDLAMRRAPEISPQRPIRGPGDAAITIVEYSDFLCPYCSSAAATVKEVMEKNQGSIRLVFKHLPLNPVSRELALGFEALALQDHDAAWTLHDMIYARQAEARGDHEAFLANVVKLTGVDPQRFAEDRKSPELSDYLERDATEARRFGFSGTPMFLINGIALRGAVPLEEFERVIALALSKSDDAHRK